MSGITNLTSIRGKDREHIIPWRSNRSYCGRPVGRLLDTRRRHLTRERPRSVCKSCARGVRKTHGI